MNNTINGRTPEEIKRGLECCKPVWVDNHWKTCDTKCPYIDDVGGFCRAQLMADALALIQQLERERDAAVSDLENNKRCETCINYTPGYFCLGCRQGSNWQWRGVQEVE